MGSSAYEEKVEPYDDESILRRRRSFTLSCAAAPKEGKGKVERERARVSIHASHHIHRHHHDHTLHVVVSYLSFGHRRLLLTVTSSPVTPTGAPTNYIHDTVSLTIVCVFSGLLLVALCCAYYWCCTSSSKPPGYKAVPQ